MEKDNILHKSHEGEENKSTHLQLQEEYGGKVVSLTFKVDGEDIEWEDEVRASL